MGKAIWNLHWDSTESCQHFQQIYILVSSLNKTNLAALLQFNPCTGSGRSLSRNFALLAEARTVPSICTTAPSHCPSYLPRALKHSKQAVQDGLNVTNQTAEILENGIIKKPEISRALQPLSKHRETLVVFPATPRADMDPPQGPHSPPRPHFLVPISPTLHIHVQGCYPLILETDFALYAHQCFLRNLP